MKLRTAGASEVAELRVIDPEPVVDVVDEPGDEEVEVRVALPVRALRGGRGDADQVVGASSDLDGGERSSSRGVACDCGRCVALGKRRARGARENEAEQKEAGYGQRTMNDARPSYAPATQRIGLFAAQLASDDEMRT